VKKLQTPEVSIKQRNYNNEATTEKHFWVSDGGFPGSGNYSAHIERVLFGHDTLRLSDSDYVK